MTLALDRGKRVNVKRRYNQIDDEDHAPSSVQDKGEFANVLLSLSGRSVHKAASKSRRSINCSIKTITKDVSTQTDPDRPFDGFDDLFVQDHPWNVDIDELLTVLEMPLGFEDPPRRQHKTTVEPMKVTDYFRPTKVRNLLDDFNNHPRPRGRPPKARKDITPEKPAASSIERADDKLKQGAEVDLYCHEDIDKRPMDRKRKKILWGMETPNIASKIPSNLSCSHSEKTSYFRGNKPPAFFATLNVQTNGNDAPLHIQLARFNYLLNK